MITSNKTSKDTKSWVRFIHWPQFEDMLQWNVLRIFKVALLDCETGRLHNFENETERSVILMSLHKVVSQEGEGTSCVAEPWNVFIAGCMHVFLPASVWISSHHNQYFNWKNYQNNNSGFLWEHCFTSVVFRQWFTGFISIRSKSWAVTIEPLSLHLHSAVLHLVDGFNQSSQDMHLKG